MRTFILTLVLLLAALLPAKAQMYPQYAAKFEKTQPTQSYSYTNSEIKAMDLLAEDEFFTYAETNAKATRMKNAGIGLLVTGGATFVTGAALWGVALGGLDTDLGKVGVSVAAVSVPFFIVGSVLYVKGKKSQVEVTPAGLAIKF